ncbi:MAG: hypothetical protein KDK30_06995 [Leptospiraceae bacterium]|nr:hypothetical protein [Leptospiraceae bacterium]MCB1314912.1 hypothetical protein [Leptospiraceae bacterium]MCB1320324.1 hypothetical protein [Leptospiraceae bacterium]
MESYLENITSETALTEGEVIRRTNAEKDQQGAFRKLTEDGAGWIVTDVIDISKGEYISEAGIIRPTDGDQLYRHKSRFGTDNEDDEALEILYSWPLYRDSPRLQKSMLEFCRASFSPQQLLSWKKNDDLKKLFVPMQQKFKIGRFVEKVDVNKLRDNRFREQLLAMHSGKHMTYICFLPQGQNMKPLFFSYGTKPHIETLKELQRQPFAFKPTHGGHIKCVREEGGQKEFLVDAGSNEFGVGMQTPLSTAEMVVDALQENWPEFDYTPVPGRDAFGLQQSY